MKNGPKTTQNNACKVKIWYKITTKGSTSTQNEHNRPQNKKRAELWQKRWKVTEINSPKEPAAHPKPHNNIKIEKPTKDCQKYLQ